MRQWIASGLPSYPLFVPLWQILRTKPRLQSMLRSCILRGRLAYQLSNEVVRGEHIQIRQMSMMSLNYFLTLQRNCRRAIHLIACKYPNGVRVETIFWSINYSITHIYSVADSIRRWESSDKAFPPRKQLSLRWNIFIASSSTQYVGSPFRTVTFTYWLGSGLLGAFWSGAHNTSRVGDAINANIRKKIAPTNVTMASRLDALFSEDSGIQGSTRQLGSNDFSTKKMS